MPDTGHLAPTALWRMDVWPKRPASEQAADEKCSSLNTYNRILEHILVRSCRDECRHVFALPPDILHTTCPLRLYMVEGLRIPGFVYDSCVDM